MQRSSDKVSNGHNHFYMIRHRSMDNQIYSIFLSDSCPSFLSSSLYRPYRFWYTIARGKNVLITGPPDFLILRIILDYYRFIDFFLISKNPY